MTQVSYIAMESAPQESFYHTWLYLQTHQADNPALLQSLTTMDPNDPNTSQIFWHCPARDLRIPNTNYRSSFQGYPTSHIRYSEPGDCPSMTEDNNQNCQTVSSDGSALSNSTTQELTPSDLILDSVDAGIYQEPISYSHGADPSCSSRSLVDWPSYESGNFPFTPLPRYIDASLGDWYTNEIQSEQARMEDTTRSEYHEPMEISDNQFSKPQQVKKFICREPGCGAGFAKKGDHKRHWSVKHNPNSKRFLCGCCKDGTSPVFKRMDKLREHKKNCHNQTKALNLQFCPDCRGVDGLEVLYFCSHENIQCHNQASHPHHGGVRCLDPPDTAKRANECEIGGTRKRLQLHPAEVESDEVKSAPKSPVLKNLELLKSSGYTLRIMRSGVSIMFSDVCFADVKKLSQKVKEMYRPPKNLPLAGNRFVLPLVNFNALKRSVMLQGPVVLINRLLRSMLDDSRISWAYQSPLNLLVSRPQSPNPAQTNTHMPKVFPMKKVEDAELLDLWHKKIITCLPGILESRIGSNYSASLVRTGKSDRCSRAMIYIQSNTLPCAAVKKHVREKIIDLIDLRPRFIEEQIQFFEGRLKTIAGGASEDSTDQSCDDLEMDTMNKAEDEAEDKEYPWYTRYHATPGPGASIGLECTKQISATIGCYVNVDGTTYILTVKHLITKSHDHQRDGARDIRTVVSPALVDADDVAETLEQYLIDLDFELSREDHLGSRYSEDISLETILTLPELTQVVLEKRDLIKDDLNQLIDDPESLKLGSVYAVSAAVDDRGDQSYAVPDSHGSNHHLDWALCTVLSPRLGSNRHRYHFDREQNIVDFYSDKTYSCGAGDPITATDAVAANDKVHFVGQATGRQSGEINAARVLICNNKRTSEEWAVILSPNQQGDSERHRGDSGASIIRDDDNKLLGLIWACTKSGQLIFTPINTVFADIQKELGANEVCLPPCNPEHPPQLPLPVEVETICRDKTKEGPKRKAGSKSRIRFRSENMQTRPRTPVLPLPWPNPTFLKMVKPLVTETNPEKGPRVQKMDTMNFHSKRLAAETLKLIDQIRPVSVSAEDKENKYSLKYILTEPAQAILHKSRTVPAPNRRQPFNKYPYRVNTWPNSLVLNSISVN